MAENDVIGAWFEALRDVGEYIGIRFGHIAPGNSASRERRGVEWHFLPHTEYDGIGGFAHLLRERGVTVEDLPSIPHPASNSLLASLRATPAMLAPRRRLPWRALQVAEQADHSAEPPQAVDWHVFDEEQTRWIRQRCRHYQVTVNSFLLKQLDRALRPHLSDPSHFTPWMVPVNMRGKVRRDNELSNHSSYVSLRIYSSDSVELVHQKIYRALANGQHWANWNTYNYTRWMNDAMRKELIKRDYAISQWNLGGFSNLGLWEVDEEPLPKEAEGDWLFCPPVLRCQMLGVGCLTFQNRLSLTLQIHPELTTSVDVARDWMEDWVREIGLELPEAE